MPGFFDSAAKSTRLVADFDYELPPDAIAQVPAEPRSSARMLVALDKGVDPVHSTVAQLATWVGEGDVIVVNETRVTSARLALYKESGSKAEVLLLEPADPSLKGVETTSWIALVRPGKRLPPRTRLYHPAWGDEPAVVVGERLDPEGRRLVELADPKVIDALGAVPLPPYIHTELKDPERYQTVYATAPGSVAAPTAGLHLTRSVLDACQARGAAVHVLELAVGLDTFRPVTAQHVEDHRMHSERYRVPSSTMSACEMAHHNRARVFAIGTTTVRALEAAAASGKLEGRTSLFIHGDFSFKMVDVLLTNFHTPRSSLLMLVEAFYGERWRELYRSALEAGYRFLSFGDAMLVGRGAGR